MTHGAFCKAASSHKIPNMIRNNPIENPGNCWENNPIVCPLGHVYGHALGVSAASTACRVVEANTNIRHLPRPFHVTGKNRILVSLIKGLGHPCAMEPGAVTLAPPSLDFIDASAREKMHQKRERVAEIFQATVPPSSSPMRAHRPRHNHAGSWHAHCREAAAPARARRCRIASLCVPKKASTSQARTRPCASMST